MTDKKQIAEGLTGLLSDTFCLSVISQMMLFRPEIIANSDLTTFIEEHCKDLSIASRDIARQISELGKTITTSYEVLEKYFLIDEVDDNMSISDFLAFLQSSNDKIADSCNDILTSYSGIYVESLITMLSGRSIAHKNAAYKSNQLLGTECNV